MVSVFKTLHIKVRDRAEPTWIGYTIPTKGQKILKFCIWFLINPYLSPTPKKLYLLYTNTSKGKGADIFVHPFLLKNRLRRARFSGYYESKNFKWILYLSLTLTLNQTPKMHLFIFSNLSSLPFRLSDFKCSTVCRPNRLFRQHNCFQANIHFFGNLKSCYG